MTKQKKMYVIRYYPTTGRLTARNVGRGRLIGCRHRAARIVKRLKKSGIDCQAWPMMIAAA